MSQRDAARRDATYVTKGDPAETTSVKAHLWKTTHDMKPSRGAGDGGPGAAPTGRGAGVPARGARWDNPKTNS